MGNAELLPVRREQYPSAARNVRFRPSASLTVRHSDPLPPTMTRILDHDLDYRLATRAVHAGQVPDPLSGAVMPPIYQTSTYRQEALGKHKGYE